MSDETIAGWAYRLERGRSRVERDRKAEADVFYIMYSRAGSEKRKQLRASAMSGDLRFYQ